MWQTIINLWLALSGQAPPRRAPRRPAFRRPSSRPRLEVLEDRCVPNAGYLDPTFGSAGAGLVAQGAQSVLIQPDGKMLAFGGSSVTRYNTDGSLDSSFGSGGVAQAIFGAGETYFSVGG